MPHRLVTPYFFALLLTVILDQIGRYLYPILYLHQTGDVLLDTIFLNKDFSLEAILPAVFILPSSAGKDFGSNGPLWSLAYETVYYAIYPTMALSKKILSNWIICNYFYFVLRVLKFVRSRLHF